MLDEILTVHESYTPLSHSKKFDLVKGDAALTIVPWLAANPHLTISMVIFDMDVYKPTRDVLELTLPILTKGSPLVCDDLNAETIPG